VPPLATIVVPTHNHGRLLRLSVGSAMAQTAEALDIVIVGDGMTDETASVARELAAGDPRVRLLEHEKGERLGEAYRDPILRRCESPYVFYLGDDDLWRPEHVETLIGLLEDRNAHFAHALPVARLADGTWAKANVDLSMAFHREAMFGSFNRISPSHVAHTREAYLRLPHGWRTSPPGTPTDLHMWRQWLEQPWVRFASSSVPTVLNFPSALRPGLDLAERELELAAHLPVICEPVAHRDWLVRVIADDFPRAAWLETHWQELERGAKAREEALRWHRQQAARWSEQAQWLLEENRGLRAERDRLASARATPEETARTPAAGWLRALPRARRQRATRRRRA
jgi:GalNAc5-diNAcBac-PP-undecaprenol beta-1,3-glucosyltransferase